MTKAKAQWWTLNTSASISPSFSLVINIERKIIKYMGDPFIVVEKRHRKQKRETDGQKGWNVKKRCLLEGKALRKYLKEITLIALLPSNGRALYLFCLSRVSLNDCYLFYLDLKNLIIQKSPVSFKVLSSAVILLITRYKENKKTGLHAKDKLKLILWIIHSGTICFILFFNLN